MWNVMISQEVLEFSIISYILNYKAAISVLYRVYGMCGNHLQYFLWCLHTSHTAKLFCEKNCYIFFIVKVVIKLEFDLKWSALYILLQYLLSDLYRIFSRDPFQGFENVSRETTARGAKSPNFTSFTKFFKH